jgi:hypothetical protein
MIQHFNMMQHDFTEIRCSPGSVLLLLPAQESGWLMLAQPCEGGG